MTDAPEPDAGSGVPPVPTEPLTPKRGAFPTPKSELEKAPRYIARVGKVDDCAETKRDSPLDVDASVNDDD